MDRRVLVFSSVLGAAAAGLVALSLLLDLTKPGEPSWVWLPVLALALAAAEQLSIRFRRGDDVNSITLSEAVLAPLVFAYDAPVPAATVLLTQLGAAVWRRKEPTKTVFNVAMWAFAASVGSVVLGALSSPDDSLLVSLGLLLLALTCIALVNNIAFTMVISISRGRSLWTVLRDLQPIIGPGWLAGWAVNLLMGLLFTLAYVGDPAASLLFPVPLVMLHLAYQGYATARIDRLRLTGLREAAHALSEPLDPNLAIDGYLHAVTRGFEARAAALVLAGEAGALQTRLLVAAGTDSGPGGVMNRPATGLEAELAALTDPARVRGAHPLAARLVADGWRDCLSAPLVTEQGRTGAVVVFDLGGLEQREQADLAMAEALARETAHTFARGSLLEDVLEERRKLDQIVSTTSDGILTLGEDGVVLSWNDACERITGLPAHTVVGRRDVLERLEARNGSGGAVDLSRPADDPALPVDLLITTAEGRRRRLSCSVSPAPGAPDDPARVVVVARDVTPAEEYEQLREQLDELVEAQEAQRLVVEHLQRAVAPQPPDVADVDVAVAYVASDPTSPTGGDLFDWQLLPSGELHVAVVDVLGHGVRATKSALTVVHTLRFLTLQGTPLDDVVRRADELLSAQQTGLVATVVVVRYDPATGAVRLVSGGHPPALLVGVDGRVTELVSYGGAIGWPGAGTDQPAEAVLEPGETLVLYTDGLVEARKDILAGTESLLRHASEVAHLPTGRYADELVSRSLAGADRRDDSLALVVRRSTSRPSRDPTRELSERV